MTVVRGYLRTIRQYLATPKGAHDSRDYAKAAALILLTMAAAAELLLLWRGGAGAP